MKNRGADVERREQPYILHRCRGVLVLGRFSESFDAVLLVDFIGVTVSSRPCARPGPPWMTEVSTRRAQRPGDRAGDREGAGLMSWKVLPTRVLFVEV